jgi:hypothetical protein
MVSAATVVGVRVFVGEGIAVGVRVAVEVGSATVGVRVVVAEGGITLGVGEGGGEVGPPPPL